MTMRCWSPKDGPSRRAWERWHWLPCAALLVALVLALMVASFSIGYASAQRDLMERMDKFAQREMQVERMSRDNAARGRR